MTGSGVRQKFSDLQRIARLGNGTRQWRLVDGFGLDQKPEGLDIETQMCFNFGLDSEKVRFSFRVVVM